jgi:5'-deoxynucleotidase
MSEQDKYLGLTIEEFEHLQGITDDPVALDLHLADNDFNPEFIYTKNQWQTDLRGIHRFAEVPMIHNSDLLQHATRVNSLAMTLTSYLIQAHGLKIDGLRVSRMALHHDDAEVITGDIPSDLKASLTPEEVTALKEAEQKAIEHLSERYMPEKYRDLYIRDYEEMAAKTSIEAQIVDIADKWDGFCEVITDIRCGNDTPEINSVMENYGKIAARLNRHPIMKQLQESPLLGFSDNPTSEEVEAYPKINLDLLNGTNGKANFWKTVFDPTLPRFYRTWLEWGSFTDSHGLGIFNRWADILKNNRLSFYGRLALIDGTFDPNNITHLEEGRNRLE